METLTERGPDYEHVEVTFDGYDLPNPYDQAPESNHEQESSVSELQYIEGPDGFYVRDPETGEAVLSMPLIMDGQQQETLNTVLTDGIANIDVPTDFGTDDEEVWSLQTFSFSGVTPEGRRIITLRATIERRPKYQEKEPQDQSDAFDTPEQAVAVTEARAAVEAAILHQDAPNVPRFEPVFAAESIAPSHSPDKVEVAPVSYAQAEQADAPAEVPVVPIPQPPAHAETTPEPKISEEATPHEVVPVFEDAVVVPEPAIQPPLKRAEPEHSVSTQHTADKPVEVRAIIEPPAKETTEPQADTELTPELLSSSVEPLTEPEDTTTAPEEPSQFELQPIKEEQPEPPVAVKKVEPQVLPPVQKTVIVTAKVKPQAAASTIKAKKITVPPTITPAIKTSKRTMPAMAIPAAPNSKQHSASRPPETQVEPKKEAKAVPQKAPAVVLETAKPVAAERTTPPAEVAITASPVATELIREASEEPRLQTHTKPTAERRFTPHIVSPLETPTPKAQKSNEWLSIPNWEQERNTQRLASVLALQGATATDSEDIVVSFVLPNPSRRTPRAHAARSIAA